MVLLRETTNDVLYSVFDDRFRVGILVRLFTLKFLVLFGRFGGRDQLLFAVRFLAQKLLETAIFLSTLHWERLHRSADFRST